MKKFTISFLTFAGALCYAQNHFSAGAYIGIPVMDTSESASLNIGAQFSYLRDLTPNFKLGASIGYSHYFIKAVVTDTGFFPFAAKAQYVFPNSKFMADLDLGYGIFNDTGISGGLYAFPKIGYKIGKSEITLGFQMINSKYKFDYYDAEGIIHAKNSSYNVGSINVGYNFYFK